jgi:hypothetical protein
VVKKGSLHPFQRMYKRPLCTPEKASAFLKARLRVEPRTRVVGVVTNISSDQFLPFLVPLSLFSLSPSFPPNPFSRSRLSQMFITTAGNGNFQLRSKALYHRLVTAFDIILQVMSLVNETCSSTH